MRIGSLFSGYGGLDMGVHLALGGRIAWHAEIDAAPSRVLAHHWPDAVNLGDVSGVNWSNVDRVDVMTGGFPCQDVSLAGLRRGLSTGTRSGLWSEFARGIDEVRPSLVVIENVRGLLSAEAIRNVESDPWGMGDRHARPSLRALGAVLGDLADLGYDARWSGFRAADAGAPHARLRIFVVANPSDADSSDRDRWQRAAGRGSLCGTTTAGHRDGTVTDAYGRNERWRGRRDVGRTSPSSAAERDGRAANDRDAASINWGKYGSAIKHWERTIGRRAPTPTLNDGKRGQPRLSSAFVEWMMGLPGGHVTSSSIGLTRTQQLKALGNGVVPQQAALAIRSLLGVDS